MAIAFDLLPIDLQALIVDLRAAATPEPLIDALIERTLHALGAKSNKIQVEVWQMETRLGAQLTQIGDKLQLDLQTQHGATNAMLADLNTAWLIAGPLIEEAGRGIAELKKQWSELSDWRSRVEAALLAIAEFRSESTSDRQQIRGSIVDLDTRHDGQIRVLIAQLASFDKRLLAIEQLLEIAGQHEAGRG